MSPLRKQLDHARRTFCAPDVPIEEFAVVSGIVYLCQRLRRGLWKSHPEFAAIEAQRAEHSLPDLSNPPDAVLPGTCPGCGASEWERSDGLDDGNRPVPLLLCGGCGRTYDPAEVECAADRLR